MGIVHRDLKLDNVIVTGLDTDKEEDINVKLIDFGLAKHSQSNEGKVNLNTYCGTLNFMAPEVIEGKEYDLSCDLWSLGVIAFFILSGKPPFFGQDDVDLVRKIASNNYDFSQEQWKDLSSESM